MTEPDPLDELFEQLFATVPDRRPPMAAITAAGRVGRRRRTTRAVLATAAAVVLVIGGSAVAVAVGGGRTHQVAPAVGPVADSGYRFVGRGQVVVQVPDSWTLGTGACGGEADTYYLTSPPAELCPALVGPEGTHVGLLPAKVTTGAPTAQSCSPQDICTRYVPVDGQPVRLVITGTSTQIGRVLDSLQILPAGLTTVPMVELRLSDAAARTLEAHGLILGPPAVDHPVRIKALDPAPGTVVPVGSTVAVARYDGQGQPTLTRVSELSQVLGTWRPIIVDHSEANVAGTEDGLTFTAQGTVVAGDGCGSNTFAVHIAPTGGLTLGGVDRRPACAPRPSTDNPTLIKDTESLRAGGDELVLIDDHQPIATYRRVGAVPAAVPTVVTSAVALVGSWLPVSVHGAPVAAGRGDRISFGVDRTVRAPSYCGTAVGRVAVAPDGTAHLTGLQPLLDCHDLIHVDSAALLARTTRFLLDPTTGDLTLRDASGVDLAMYVPAR